MKKLLFILALIFAAPTQAHPHQATPADASLGPNAPHQKPKIDLNLATLQELCTLPGIGAKKAKAIIAYREKRPFSRITQLAQVKGIGSKTVRRLKSRLTVHSGPPLTPK